MPAFVLDAKSAQRIVKIFALHRLGDMCSSAIALPVESEPPLQELA